MDNKETLENIINDIFEDGVIIKDEYGTIHIYKNEKEI